MIQNQIAPDVQQMIIPIIDDMTQIYTEQKLNPNLNIMNENIQIKQKKRTCVHILRTSDNSLTIPINHNAKGEVICEACGRKIEQEFNIEKDFPIIEGTIDIVNKLLTYGQIQGMTTNAIRICLDLKCLLPELMKLDKNLTDFMKLEDAKNDTINNLGSEFGSRRNSIIQVY